MQNSRLQCALAVCGFRRLSITQRGGGVMLTTSERTACDCGESVGVSHAFGASLTATARWQMRKAGASKLGMLLDASSMRRKAGCMLCFVRGNDHYAKAMTKPRDVDVRTQQSGRLAQWIHEVWPGAGIGGEWLSSRARAWQSD
jgi:hypothetical protein